MSELLWTIHMRVVPCVLLNSCSNSLPLLLELNSVSVVLCKNRNFFFFLNLSYPLDNFPSSHRERETEKETAGTSTAPGEDSSRLGSELSIFQAPSFSDCFGS